MSDSIEQVLAALDAGGVVVVPTDTVYGIAARLDRSRAIATIFELKGRPRDKPLPVLGAGAEDLEPLADFDEKAHRLAAVFWPGPLTLVLPRKSGFGTDIGGEPNDSTVGVRVPGGQVRELLERAGPLAVTSANASGGPPAQSIEEARKIFGERVDAYLDGGVAEGEASTVVSVVSEPIVLRDGAVARAEILAALES